MTKKEIFSRANYFTFYQKLIQSLKKNGRGKGFFTSQAPRYSVSIFLRQSMVPPGGTVNLIVSVRTDQGFLVIDRLNQVIFSSSLGGSFSVNNNGHPVDGTVSAIYEAPISTTGVDRITASFLNVTTFIQIFIRNFNNFFPIQMKMPLGHRLVPWGAELCEN